MTDSLVPATQNLAVLHFSDEQKELIKRTICKGASDDELALFVHVAQKSGLDPFSKQIYAIKRRDNRTGQDVMTVQTSIDGYRVIAERSGRYAPGKAPVYEYKSDGTLKSATVQIMKLVRDQWFPVEATAFYEEYKQDMNWIWKKMPHVMLAKCAEALALRRAFPNETSGIYTAEEMGQAEGQPTRIVKQPTEKQIDATRPVETLPDEPPIETGEVAQPDIPFPGPNSDEMPSENLFKHFQSTLRETGTKEKVKKFCEMTFGKTSSKQLTASEIQQVLEMVQKGAIRADL